jgi:hypothetical protein
MIRKTSTIEATFIKDSVKNCSLEDFIEESTRSKSCWFKALPSNISFYLYGKVIPSIRGLISNINHRVKYQQEEYASYWQKSGNTLVTAKFCPGIHSILDTSLLIKAPADMHITVFRDGTWLANSADSSLVQIVEDHPVSQVLTPSTRTNIFKDRVFIKFKLPVHLSSNQTYVFLQPQYHNNYKVEVMNGVIHPPHSQQHYLSVIGAITYNPDKDYDIRINKGDVLAYLWSPNKLKLKYKNRDIPEVHRSTFVNSIDIATKE